MPKNLKKLTLLHSNDLHGDFFAEKIDESLIGGVSMLSGYISKVRETEPNVLYCVAGDMFRGNVIDSEFKGVSTIEIMNMLNPDVVTIGNHEVDYGVTHLLFIEKCAKFPIINANMYISTNGVRLFKPCKEKEIGGMKILFIGILTEQALSTTKKEAMIGTMVDIADAAKEVERICNSYRSTDIDFTVLLTHIGFEEDKKLAAALDPDLGVDVIIGGHSHTLLEKPEKVNDILIVQAGIGTNQIGRFDIMVDTDNNCVDSYEWKTVEISADTCPVDENMNNLLKKFKEVTDAKFGRLVSRLTKQVTHPSRYQETSLGNLFADALKESFGTDIMLLGSGGLRVKTFGPVVTFGDMMDCYPYDDVIFQLNVNGAQLKRMFKHILREEVWAGDHCEFYQLSRGLSITYNRSTGEFESFLYNGKPIADDQMVSIAMEGYHFKNFEKFTSVPLDEVEKNGKAKKICTSSFQVLEEYLSTHQMLNADIEDRLVIR